MRPIALVALAMILAAPVSAQPTPYAGLERREVKSLSAEQSADLRAGRGMGLALPAELNGYPGPSHTLELAQQLGLSADQSATVRGLLAAMRGDAIPIGERLVRQETELDGLFASKSVTPQKLAMVTTEIGATQAALRNAHLKYHLATVAVLTPDQVTRYGESRGYGAGTPARQHRHHPR